VVELGFAFGEGVWTGVEAGLGVGRMGLGVTVELGMNVGSGFGVSAGVGVEGAIGVTDRPQLLTHNPTGTRRSA
jgi:pantoate kinase